MAIVGNYACLKSDFKCSNEQVCTQRTKTTSNDIELSVTCCDEESTGSRPGCVSSVDFQTAYTHCEDQGLRLCTADEIKSGSGERTGCGFDDKLIWTSTSCELEGKYSCFLFYLSTSHVGNILFFWLIGVLIIIFQ